MKAKQILQLTIVMGLTAACNPPKAPRYNKGDSGNAMADHMGSERPVDPAEARKNLEDILTPDDNGACNGKAMRGTKNLRLLTHDELYNSLKDILKIKTDFRGSLPPENKVNGFRNDVSKGRISIDHEIAYMDVALMAAEEAKANLQTLVACTEAAGESCAQKIIATLAPKLYRRPLTEQEKAEALAFYKRNVATSSSEAMTLLLSSLVLSPHFLYRSEIGDNVGKLNAYEMASALSFFFWGTSPDDRLISLAASNKLLEEATILAEADRLWKDPRSRFVTNEFVRAWMRSLDVRGAVKDAQFANILTQEIKDAMSLEMEDTFDYFMRQPNASFESLFTNDFSIGSANLASYYKGQSEIEDGVTKIRIPNASRKGLLSLGAVNALLASSNETHPIRRGEFVLSHMLCFIPPPTPPGLEVKIPPANPNATTRERFAAHSADPACKVCHEKIDGIGFGMEDFDSLGLYRSQDNGKPVDSTGELVGIDGTNTKFKGVAELSEALANSQQAKRCFALQWYRMAHGRQENTNDVCAVRDVGNTFSKSELSMSELLVKIITHPSYANRGQ